MERRVNEVSTRVFGSFLTVLQRRNVSLNEVVAGTTVTVADLRDRKRRISWAEHVAIMNNLRPHFTDEELVEVGRSYFRAPALRFAFVVARMLFTPLDFYRWANKPRDGVGVQMFTCITPSQREISEREIEVDLLLRDGLEICREFFIVAIGNFEEMPRLLGCPAAKVTLTYLPNGARYRILVPQQTRFLTKVWRAVTWPFAARSAARELKEAHESLLERYRELETSRARLDRQAAQLRIAHSISGLVQRELDLTLTMDRTTTALISEAGFSSATLEVRDGEEVLTTRHGAAAGLSHTQPLLGQGGAQLGEVTVTLGEGADPQERQELVEFVAPMLSMALQNAISYRHLEKYRANLEQLVESRTADLRATRDDLAAMVVQLREVQGSRDAFFANISHEIRTPLSLILLAAADIEAQLAAVLDERSRANLGSVVSSARKLLRLVDELLLLAAGEADKLRLRPERLDVGATVLTLVEAWRPAAAAAGVSLTRSGPATLVAEVDASAVDRIITNLLSNAVKFTPRGGDIWVTVEGTPQAVVLSVRDNGVGIDDELAGRLFGRFERAASTSKSGSGIGLSLVKQLAEAHGGAVELRRPDGGGAEFRVQLPRVQADLAAASRGDAAATPPSSAPPLRRLEPVDFGQLGSAPASGEVRVPAKTSLGKILLAEDDVGLSEMVARLLVTDYTVIIAYDGAAALRLASEHQPHLLVTDVQMPEMNGIELAQRFRSATNDRLAPVIIMSAASDLGTRVQGLEAGAMDYVIKPFDPLEFRARVRSQFRMRELAVRLHQAEQLSALGTLSAGLAHEIRNPANGIINAIRPLSKLLPPELRSLQSPVGQLLEVAAGCADQIAFLSRQLLNFRSRGDLELRSVALPDLVRRTLTLTQEVLTGVEVKMDLGFEGQVRCAPQLMLQVLTNLIDNAAHAAQAGGWVEVISRADHQKITIEVSDSGQGVPMELRERVFEPFFTTKPPGVGTGLGLPLSRDIVHRHGGCLEIRDRAARCVFAIDLPL
jgi:signal transduction histidine kinase